MPLARFGDRIVFFVHIPKTGGASVDHYLAAHGAMALWTSGGQGWAKCSPQHIHAAVYDRIVPRGFADAAFTIVRNPLTRLISEYRYRKARRKLDIGFDDWALRAMAKRDRDPYALDNHLRPQHEFIRGDLTLFRFEDGLEPVFDWIDGQAGVPRAERPWANKASGDPVVPGAQIQALIRDIYAEDFKLWEGL